MLTGESLSHTFSHTIHTIGVTLTLPIFITSYEYMTFQNTKYIYHDIDN